MGGKRRGARKYFHLCAAGLIVLTLTACASISALVCGREEQRQEQQHEQQPQQPEPHGHLLSAQPFISQGDFEGALRESQERLALSPKDPPGDEALFDMALIYAHSGNPKKDYRKSLSLFTRLVKEFTQSQLVEEAKIWIGVLDSIEKAKQVDIEIEEKKKGLAK